MGAEAFGFASDPPEPEPNLEAEKIPISCGYEYRPGRRCDFSGYVLTDPRLPRSWTCPSCGGLHEDDPTPDRPTEKEED